MPHTDEIKLYAEPSLFGGSRDTFLQDEDSLTVAELIPRILVERKSFLNISEASIAAEIEQKSSDMAIDETPGKRSAETPEKSSFSPAEAGSAISGDQEDEESALERFQKQKNELLAHLGSALNETSLSLDFVSLLMSAVKPNITKSTISPHLSQTAPLGSLSADRLNRNSENNVTKDPKSTRATEKLGLGWKYQSLRNVTGLFKAAANQIRGQVAVEQNYWQQIRKVLAHDEVLYKLRDPADNSRAIGVRYGYGDSGSTYHDKGHAVLRKNPESGDLRFCPVSTSSSGRVEESRPRHKYTRVRILSKIDDDYMLTGQSRLRKEEFEAFAADPLLSDIEKARFFLFEDDLFYHLIREAKNLVSYNISIIADKIIVDAVDHMLEFESVAYDENNDDDELSNVYQSTSVESCRDNERAQHILRFLKIMLCCYFQYRLKLKQKMPTSFTKWKQANSHPLLLRPLLGHTRHQSNFSHVTALLQRLCQDLDPASVSYGVSENMYVSLDVEKVTNPFQKAIQRPISRATLVLERVATSAHLKAEIEVTTTEIFVDLMVNLSVSKYKSKEDLEANSDGSNVLSLQFTDLMDLGESLEWTLQNFLEEDDS